MVSRPISKTSTQRKLSTYGKSARDQVGTKSQTVSSVNHAPSSIYDFPDSDDSGSSPPSPNPISKQKPLPHRAHAALKATTPVRSPSNRSSGDDTRKRKHAKAFDADLITKQAPSLASRSKTSTTPSTEKRATPPKKTTPPKNEATIRARTTPIRSPAAQAPSPRAQIQPPPRVTASSSTPPTSNPSRASSQPRKSRLIDRLAAQKVDDSGSDSDSGPDPSASASEDGTDRIPPQLQTPLAQRSGPSETEIWSRPTYSQLGASATKKIKHTYSQARSILGDTQSQDDPYGLSSDLPDDSLRLSPPPQPILADEFDMSDEDDDAAPTIGIKSVHELRRAGANNRFTDEMEDLLSRIGTPTRSISSMRRNALLELAQKLQRGDFASQFRDHVARDNIAKKIGDEADVISGFAMAAGLVIFLSSHNAPHLLRRLMEERIGKLLGRLLRTSEDVDVIAGGRSSNLSKSSKNTLSSIKSCLVRLQVWRGYSPTTLSPRRVALQLCHLLQSNLDARNRADLSRDIEQDFADIVETQAQRGSAEDVDFALSVLIMESESGPEVAALGRDRIDRHAPSYAQIFQRTLDTCPKNRGEIKSAALKLAINTTNTEAGAQAFGDGAMLANLARLTSDGLCQAQQAIKERNLEGSMYDGLLLLLGIMINVLEHFPPARASLDEGSLEQLAGLFIEHRESAGDADSEEKSKVSVAFGYLAVVLGYLCLEDGGRRAIGLRSQGSGIGGLIDSIREFIGLYRTIDPKVHELEGLAQELRRLNR